MKPNGFLGCGAIGTQPVNCEYKEGKLIAVYFTWDREKICNLLLFMTEAVFYEGENSIEADNRIRDSRASEDDQRLIEK